MNASDELHSNYTLTPHAQRAAQQRGIALQTVQCVLYNADIRNHRGEGKMSFAISKKKLKQLRAQGYPPKTIEKLHAVVVLVEPLNKKVVSVWHSFKKSGRLDYKQGSTYSEG
ncbi:MAG: hypothetical protein F4Z01_03165 [Gammaproteobacteria bacterium]|nr:hypothetical protein [Gammaproteobacteria bacterium]MYF37388.1 hypothetical protein [Gammaproteobacteria bacterium]